MGDDRRSYDSPVRRRRTAETRERIIASGTSILHEHAAWNWDALTIRAVAERAGVHERTVYRHFENEHRLREAVLEQLEAESGVDLDGLRLDNLQTFTRELLGYVGSFPLSARVPEDAALLAAGRRKHRAASAVVSDAAPDWTGRERAIATASIDVMWTVGTYERLMTEGGLDTDDAVTAATWIVALIEREIRADRPPAD